MGQCQPCNLHNFEYVRSRLSWMHQRTSCSASYLHEDSSVGWSQCSGWLSAWVNTSLSKDFMIRATGLLWSIWRMKGLNTDPVILLKGSVKIGDGQSRQTFRKDVDARIVPEIFMIFWIFNRWHTSCLDLSRGCEKLFDVQAGWGDSCCCGPIKPAVGYIQVVRQ